MPRRAGLLAVIVLFMAAEHFLARPVRQLIALADAVGQGRYQSMEIVPTDRTEFGRLGRALKAMAGALTAREAALRESEARLATAITGTGLATWTMDTSTWSGVGDARLAALAGLPPERTELTVGEWQAFLHPEDKERLIADIVAELRARGRSHRSAASPEPMARNAGRRRGRRRYRARRLRGAGGM